MHSFKDLESEISMVMNSRNVRLIWHVLITGGRWQAFTFCYIISSNLISFQIIIIDIFIPKYRIWNIDGYGFKKYTTDITCINYWRKTTSAVLFGCFEIWRIIDLREMAFWQNDLVWSCLLPTWIWRWKNNIQVRKYHFQSDN